MYKSRFFLMEPAVYISAFLVSHKPLANVYEKYP